MPRQRRRSPGRPGSVLRLWPAIPVLWLVLVLGIVAPASAGPEPLPPCRYDDVPAAATDYADWQSTLVDTIFMVPSSYAPPDLAPVSQAGLSGGDSVRALLMDDLTRLAADAKGAGASLAVESGYRSYENQVATFQHWVDVSGHDAALRVSARPGHSEHQLGTAIDFKSAGGPAPWEVTDWATTLVFDVRTWLGVGLAGLAVVLWLVSGFIRDRQLARGQAAGAGGRTARGKSELPEASSTRTGPTSRPAVDDEMADIEALLRKRGIE